MRKAFAAGVLTLSFGFAFVAYAQTSAQLQAELNALLQQLAALQAQLQVTTGSPTTPAATGVSGQCPALSRSLRQGMSGSDVSALQAFLARDTRLYPEGTVSGYFGALTQAAVQRFQVRHAIVTSGNPDTTGYGAVGPATRAAIQGVCASGTNMPPSSGGSNCVLGGRTVANGQTATFYSLSSVPLNSSCEPYRQTRQCINGVLSGDNAYQYASCGVGTVTTPGSCLLDGEQVQNGGVRTFFRQETPPFGQQCQGAARTCTNGILGGSSEYQYAYCILATAPLSCRLDGVTVPHGQSHAFYKQSEVMFGQNCSAFVGTRACDNGSLSGSSDYRYASCTAAGAKSCTVVSTVGTTTSTTTVAHGASRNFWSQSSVPYTGSCDTYRLSRTCNDGVLSGVASYRYPSCEVIPQKTCAIDGLTMQGGTSRTFYSARAVGANGNCSSISQSRTCTNGVLSGGASYQYAYCARAGQRYCVLDGVYVQHGASRSFYSTQTASFGSSCAQFSQSRSCNDGTLGGGASYRYASCMNATGASCALDGQTVSHGSTHTFYSRRTAPSNANCAQYAQARTCIDGNLSGSGNFEYQSCSDSTSSMGNTSQVAAALTAMEALLKDALAKLDSWF